MKINFQLNDAHVSRALVAFHLNDAGDAATNDTNLTEAIKALVIWKIRTEEERTAVQNAASNVTPVVLT